MAPLASVNYPSTSSIPESEPQEPEHPAESGHSAPTPRPMARQRTGSTPQSTQSLGNNQQTSESTADSLSETESEEQARRALFAEYEGLTLDQDDSASITSQEPEEQSAGVTHEDTVSTAEEQSSPVSADDTALQGDHASIGTLPQRTNQAGGTVRRANSAPGSTGISVGTSPQRADGAGGTVQRRNTTPANSQASVNISPQVTAGASETAGETNASGSAPKSVEEQFSDHLTAARSADSNRVTQFAHSAMQRARKTFSTETKPYTSNPKKADLLDFAKSRSSEEAQGLLKTVQPGGANREQFKQLSPSAQKNLLSTLKASSIGRTTEFEGSNDLDKGTKNQAEYQDTHVHGADAYGGNDYDSASSDEDLENEVSNSSPDDDRGRTEQSRSSYNQVYEREEKDQKLFGGTVKANQKRTVKKNVLGVRKYDSVLSGTIGLAGDIKEGQQQSVEANKSSFAPFIGIQGQANLREYSYEGKFEANLGNSDLGVALKPKGKAVTFGISGQAEAGVQLGGNLNAHANLQGFVGTRVDAEVGVEVGHKVRTTKADGTVKEVKNRIFKGKARVIASGGAEVNATALAGKAQLNGEDIAGLEGSVDLFAGVRVQTTLQGEFAGVGVAHQVSAMAGVGLYVSAGLKKQGGTLKLQVGYGAAAGVGAAVLHEVTFNPGLAKEAAVSGARAIKKLPSKVASAGRAAVSATRTIPNLGRKRPAANAAPAETAASQPTGPTPPGPEQSVTSTSTSTPVPAPPPAQAPAPVPTGTATT
jgi:hypothetical protein